MKMNEWKTLKQETIEIGSNNFIEINLKQPPENQNILIGISKGWYNSEGKKRYKNNILFNKEKKEKIIEVLNKIDSD